MKYVNNENGSVTIIILIFFMTITISFFAIYQLVLDDYVVSSISMEEKSEGLNQSNLLESLRVNYEKDMKNDISFEELDKTYKTNDDWKIDYQNFIFNYIKTDEKGNPLEKRGEFGRFEWVDFINYQDVIPDADGSEADNKLNFYRLYNVKDNWKLDDDSGVFNKDRNSLSLPNEVYIKINFDSRASRIKMTFGNNFETKEEEFINRQNGVNVFKVKDLPPSVEEITIESDNNLGSTKFSLLKAREIDLEVYEKNKYGVKSGKKLLTKTLRIELGKNKNIPKFLNIGSEVE